MKRRTFLATAASFSRVLGANDRINLGVVGVGSTVKIGGKGKGDAKDFARIAGVRVAAFCDVDHANLDPEVQKWRDRREPVEAYTDVRKLLDNKDIDIISVTTPNHWHALITVWACQAGKDVFVQKPASHTLLEGRKMVEASRKYNRIVQCPSNSRSPNGVMEAIAWARQGKLGRILYVHGVNLAARTGIGQVPGPRTIPQSINYDLWCGPAPVLPLLRENLHYDWHWQWPYGDGELGNWGPHILDGCRMAIGAQTPPRHVICLGGRFGYRDDGQTPNSQLMFFDYQPAPILFEIRGLPREKSLLATAWDKNQNQTMDTYCGIRQGTVIHCEGGYVAQNKAFDKTGKLLEQFQPASPNLNVNFIGAVRSRRRQDLAADIEEGHQTVSLIHMANISYRLGKTAAAGEIRERIAGHKGFAAAFDRFQDHLRANEVDVDKTIAGPMLTLDPASLRFSGDFSAEANRLAHGEYRKPFLMPQKV